MMAGGHGGVTPLVPLSRPAPLAGADSDGRDGEGGGVRTLHGTAGWGGRFRNHQKTATPPYRWVALNTAVPTALKKFTNCRKAIGLYTYTRTHLHRRAHMAAL